MVIIGDDGFVSILATEFNVLYQAIFGATDEPVIDENVHFEQGVLYTGLELTDGQLFILAKNESDEFILVAVTTEEYGSQEIVDLAYMENRDFRISEICREIMTG